MITITINAGSWLYRFVREENVNSYDGLMNDPENKYGYVLSGIEPQTLESIIMMLGIPLGEVGIVTKDQKAIELTTVIDQDCSLVLFPVIVGG